MKRPAPIRVIGLALLTGFLFLVAPTLGLAQSDGGQTITLAEAGRARCQIVAAPDADRIET